MESPENNVKSVLTVLPIGQGACNLVEVYDNLNKLVFLGLVDCGNKTNEQAFNVTGYSGEFNSNVEASFDYITKKMRERAQNENDGSTQETKYKLLLDLFILTHQDGDHWILLEKMLERVKGYVCYKNPRTENTDKSLYCEEEKNIEKSLVKYKILYKLEYDKKSGQSYSYFVFIDNYIMKVFFQKTGTKTELIYENGSVKLTRSCNKDGEVIKLNGKIIDNVPNEYAQIICYFDMLQNNINYTKEHVESELNKGSKVEPFITNFLKGGDEYTKKAADFSKEFSWHLSKTTNWIAPTNKYKENIFENGYVSIDLLCGTVRGKSNSKSLEKLPVDRARDYNKKNATSAVTLWTIGDTKYLFPGDATVHTMMHLNNLDNINNHTNAIMTAPHHGSDNSSKGKKRPASPETKYQGDWGIYREFLDNYKPSAVTISAGRNYGFGHPGPEFVKATDCYFNNTGANEHIIYTCIGEYDKTKYYGLYQTSSPIYSTLQYDKNDKKVYFQRLHFTNDIISDYRIVNDTKIACRCNPNLSNYLKLDVGSCTGCSPKFIDESSSSSYWFCKYICERTMAKDENTEDDKSASSTETRGCFPDECIEEEEEVEVEMKGAAKERSNHKPMSEMPRPVKRRRTE